MPGSHINPYDPVLSLFQDKAFDSGKPVSESEERFLELVYALGFEGIAPDQQQLIIRKDLDTHDRDILIAGALARINFFNILPPPQEELQEKEQELIRQLGQLRAEIRRHEEHSPVPEYIIHYLCRKTLVKTVIQVFNQFEGWECSNIKELRIKTLINPKVANDIFNTIRICDPVVASGRFLICFLNEIITLKSNLGLLLDKRGLPVINYRFQTEKLHLYITDVSGRDYQYNPRNPESQRLRETLFHETSDIVSKCLFGVDLNPVAVAMTKLNLWIKILKHNYRTADRYELQPLPNLEINIRRGNSLISYSSLNDDLPQMLHNIGSDLKDYLRMAKQLKRTLLSEEKNQLSSYLSIIRNNLLGEETRKERIQEEHVRWNKELSSLTAPQLFPLSEKEEIHRQKQIDSARKMLQRYERKIVETAKHEAHTFEWRFDFPDMLDKRGEFAGFDIITGNPPAVWLQKLSTDYRQQNYKVYRSGANTTCLFYEQGINLLKPNGMLAYFSSGDWMYANFGDKLREFIASECNPIQIIDFSVIRPYTDQSTTVMAAIVQKGENLGKTYVCRIGYDFDPQSTDLFQYVSQNGSTSGIDQKGVSSFVLLSSTERKIKQKVEQVGIPLQEWKLNFFTGIKTGLNEAINPETGEKEGVFVISKEQKEEFESTDRRSADIIKPLLRGRDIRNFGHVVSEQWILSIPWHFPLHYDKTITAVNEKLEYKFRLQYPLIYNHLEKYKDQLMERSKTETGIRYEWYAVHRWGADDWDDYFQPKIAWPRITPTVRFCIDYDGHVMLDSVCFITGARLKYLLGVLNSKLLRYILTQIAPKSITGDLLLNLPFIQTIHVPMPNTKIEMDMNALVSRILVSPHAEEEQKINEIVYQLYGLDEDEIRFIESKKLPSNCL